MARIYQVIDDLTVDAMRELLTDRVGKSLSADSSEYSLRETIKGLYECDLLTARDIREMAEGA